MPGESSPTKLFSFDNKVSLSYLDWLLTYCVAQAALNFLDTALKSELELSGLRRGTLLFVEVRHVDVKTPMF